MKRQIQSVALASALLGIAGASASAQVDSHSLPVHLQVTSRFGLTVDKSSLELGSISRDGDFQSRINVNQNRSTLNLTAISNHDQEWTVQLAASPLTHSDGVTKIPADNFRYYFANDGSGRESPAIGADAPVPSSLQAIYQAAESEYITLESRLALGFRVTVPPDQKTGSYSSTLQVTLADSF